MQNPLSFWSEVNTKQKTTEGKTEKEREKPDLLHLFLWIKLGTWPLANYEKWPLQETGQKINEMHF